MEEIAMNIDLHATIADLSGAGVAANADGHSLLPLLQGKEVSQWRTLALIEHRGRQREANADDPDTPTRRSGNPPTYEAVRTAASLYVEYVTGDKEYHDLASDPHELRNTFASLSSVEQALLTATLAAAKSCRGAKSCWAAERPAERPQGEQLGATSNRQ
jgi:N-acetylglucosamine-6-sulfatase